MADEQQHRTADRLDSPPDTGLKRLLIYTFIALVLAVLAALVAVNLVTRWFDTG